MASSLSVEIVLEGTFSTLSGGQPYAQYVNSKGLFAYATDEDAIYRIDKDGNLAEKLGSSNSTIVVLPAQTGTAIAVPGMLATSDVEIALRDNTFLWPDEYTKSTDTVTLNDSAISEEFFFRFKN